MSKPRELPANWRCPGQLDALALLEELLGEERAEDTEEDR